MLKRIIIYFFTLLALVSCETEHDSPYPPISFIQLKPAPLVSRACGTAFTINNKAYVTLGRRGNIITECWEFASPAEIASLSSLNSQKVEEPEYDVLLRDFYEYDPEDDSWTRKDDFPGQARSFPVSAVVDGKAYVGLGYNYGCAYLDTAFMQDFWMFDPLTEDWTRKANFPTRASNAAVSFVHKGEIYVMHGFTNGAFDANVWKYNPGEDRWIQLRDFPGYVRTRAVACSNGDRLFAGTGYAKWNENDWWEYFPDKDTWEKKKKMPDTGRINALALAVSDRIFVTTGRYFAGMHTGGHLKSDVVEYDAAKNQWYKRGEISSGARENALGFVLKGRVYIGFGENESRTLDDFGYFIP